MAPRNPSEIARLEDELTYQLCKLQKLSLGKESRERILREIRKLEEQLGIESKPYNV